MNKAITDTRQTDRLYDAFFEESTLPYCEHELARSFLSDVAECSPFAQSSLIEQNLLPALNDGTPRAVQNEIVAKVAAAACDNSIWQPFERHDKRIVESFLKDFSDAVNRGGNRLRTVLFVATIPYFVILKEAIYLRRNGHRVFLISLSPIPENILGIFETHFDGLAHTGNSFRLMRAALRNLNPDIVHVQCWMWMYILGRLAIEAYPGKAVVCEFYDATSLFADRLDMAAKWDPLIIDLDHSLERFIMHNASAIVSRYAPDIGETWAKSHGAAPRYLELQPYPCPEFIHYSEDRPSQKDGIIRLVHAGSFAPLDDDHPPTLFPEVSMPDTFLSLLKQGFAVDVFMPPQINREKLGPSYDAYRNLAKDFDTFRFLPGVSPDDFAEVISSYDYGILLFDYDPTVARISHLWMRGCMPTRFFSYLEAGLPGIVIAECENMTRFLEDNGVGLGVPSKEISRLAEILSGYDRDRAVGNIRRYNETHGMDKEISRLMEVYDEIAPRPEKRHLINDRR